MLHPVYNYVVWSPQRHEVTFNTGFKRFFTPPKQSLLLNAKLIKYNS